MEICEIYRVDWQNDCKWVKICYFLLLNFYEKINGIFKEFFYFFNPFC